MTKQDFLDELRISLTGKVSTDIINDNIRYYEDYINAQVRQGKNEETVFKELGNPRLIAKTILEAEKQSGNEYETAGEERNEDNAKQNTYGKIFQIRRMPLWLLGIIAVFVLLPIIALIFMFISWIAPFFFMAWLVFMVVRILKSASK